MPEQTKCERCNAPHIDGRELHYVSCPRWIAWQERKHPTLHNVRTMVRYTLHVPQYDNAGGSIDTVHTIVQNALAELAGGWTETVARGGWRGPTRSDYESVVLYAVDVADDSDAYARLHALAQIVKRDAAQEAVYLTRQPIETWCV